MKKIVLFGLVGAALTFGATAMSNAWYSDASPVQVKAENSTRLYIDTSADPGWLTYGSIYLKCYNDAPSYAESFSPVTLHDGSVYYVDADLSSWSKVQFVEYEGGSPLNYGPAIEVSSAKNFFKLTDWKAGDWYFVEHVDEGETYFVNFDAVAHYWFDGTLPYFYAYYPSGYNTLDMTRVGSSNVFTVTIPSGGIYIQRFVVVRGDSSFTGADSSNWDSHRINQTSDYSTNSYQVGQRAIYVSNEGDTNSKTSTLQSLSDNYLVDGFSAYFLNATSEYCGREIDGDETAGIKATFDDFVSCEVTDFKGAFTSGVITHSADGHLNNANNALSRYWDMTHDSSHGKGSVYDDFLELGDTFMARPVNFSIPYKTDSISDNSVLVITILTVAALIGGAGYIAVSVKRRKD